MRQTRDFAKAGTTDYWVSVTCRIPIAPEGVGNMGLIGADEEFRSAEADTVDAAKLKALELARELNLLHPAGYVVDATITAQVWEADTYEFEGETIQDACSTEGKQVYGVWDQDGNNGFRWDDQ